MRRATVQPEATLLTTEYLVFRSQRWNCRMHGDKIMPQSWWRCSRNISIRNKSLKTWVKSKRSTSSAVNRKNYSATWTTQRSSNFAKNLPNINVLIAMPFQKSGSFIAVAWEIWSIRPIAILLQSLALSLRRVPVQDQNMVLLKDRWCFLQGEGEWQPSDDTFKVVRTRRIPKVIGGAQYWRKRSHAFRSHRSWKTWLYSYTSWTVTERQTLDSSFECWWASKASSTATRICRCINTMLQNARRSLGGNATISETDTSRTSATSTTRSAIRRRRKLRLLCRSQDWMAVLHSHGKPVGSVFIFNFVVANFTMANELELMVFHIIW